jgi:hypothetical protein
MTIGAGTPYLHLSHSSVTMIDLCSIVFWQQAEESSNESPLRRSTMPCGNCVYRSCSGRRHQCPLLTYTFDLNGGHSTVVVQGNSLTSFAEAYGAPDEGAIAVAGDIRTAGAFPGWLGGQYSLAGTPTGTAHPMGSIASSAYDSTTDGSRFHPSRGSVYRRRSVQCRNYLRQDQQLTMDLGIWRQ